MTCSLCGSTNANEAVACASCGASLSRDENLAQGDALPPGATLQYGTYRIDAVLGQGGFGITYRGFDLSLQRPVAIKEFFPFGCRRFPVFTVQPSQALSPGDYQTSKQRFVEVARVLARFKHAAIVDVYSVWEENNAAYMVMELLEGQTLEEVLHARNAPLDESEVLDLAQRIGEALGEVHRRGLLHRDIKPANIVQCDDGRVMLIDFGTAREYSKDAPQMQGHSIVVTPGYAPLEQYAERATRGAYTDVYSLSATMYHLLTGEMPPAASDRALGVELRPAHELNPQISPTVSAALSCAMETQVTRRPQSVDEFLQMLHGNRAAAMAPQPPIEQLSTRLASVVEDKREPQAETLSSQPQNEPMSDEGREKLETMFEGDMSQQYQTGTAARKAFLESFPSALVTSPGEFSQPDALATSRPPSSASLQQTMTEQQSLFPPQDSSVQVRKFWSPLQTASIIFGGIFVIALLSIVGGVERHVADNQSTTPVYNSQSTLSVDDFLRSQNLEPQQPVAVKTFPELRSLNYGFCQFSADGKSVAVQDGVTYQIHIYEVPSLRPVSVLPLIGGGFGYKFSADGSYLLVKTIKNLQLWDVKGAKQKFLWRVKPAGASDSRPSDISPNGKLVIGMPDPSTVAVWSVESGKLLYKKQVPALYSPLFFTQDSKQWVSFFPDASSQKQIQRYEARAGKKRAAQDFPISEDLYNPQLLLDNRFVAQITRPTSTGGVTLSAVVDFQSADVGVQQIPDIAPSSWSGSDSHGFPISRSWSVAWSSGAHFVLGLHSFESASFDSISFVRRFDPKTTKPLGVAVLSTAYDTQFPTRVFPPPSGGMFSPDNKFLYVISGDGKLLTWHLDQLKWQ